MPRASHPPPGGPGGPSPGPIPSVWGGWTGGAVEGLTDAHRTPTETEQDMTQEPDKQGVWCNGCLVVIFVAVLAWLAVGGWAVRWWLEGLTGGG